MTSHNEDKNTLDFEGDSRIVRRVYRIPVDSVDQVSVTIDGKTYPVLNIVDRGLQIACEAAGEFEEGKDLGSIELVVQGQTMAVQAQVVYTSQIDLEAYACGMAIQFSNEDDEKQVRRFLDTKRNELFGPEPS